LLEKKRNRPASPRRTRDNGSGVTLQFLSHSNGWRNIAISLIDPVPGEQTAQACAIA